MRKCLYYVRCVLLLLLGFGLWSGAPASTARHVRPSAQHLPPDSTYLKVDDPAMAFPEMWAANDSLSCVLPFVRAGNLILVKATADTTEGNFIFDTGAQNLVLNITYFREYPQIKMPGVEKTSITGTTTNAIKTNVKKLTIGDLTYFRNRADLINLGHIENSKGVKILGLLGMELFRQCEVIIDYEKSLIYFHRIGKKEANSYQSTQLADPSAFHLVPISLKENRIIINTELEGKKVNFVIDSGAESNLLDSRLPNKIFENVTITGRVMLSGTGTIKTEALRGDLKNIMFGSQSIQNMPVIITNLENTCFSYNGCVNGVLGFDFLTVNKSRVGFNFVKREMYIWK